MTAVNDKSRLEDKDYISDQGNEDEPEYDEYDDENYISTVKVKRRKERLR